MRLLLVCAILVTTFYSTAQEITIIPQPRVLQAGRGSFSLSSTTVIVSTDAQNEPAINFFNRHLQTWYGFQLPVVQSATSPSIRFTTKKFMQPGTDGKYELRVSEEGIEISGDSYSGTFYGMQTLLQLLPLPATQTDASQIPLPIPQLAIQDEPRFAYRGMHLDVGRHFQPVSYIKRYIDFLAYHKLNKFHWHLTEDQGWRIEIKQYPLLTAIGSNRNGTIIGRYPGKGNDNKYYTGFYTQEEIREVVQYAAERFIEVIPEIEMPGHSSAAIAAYPWLSCFPQKPTLIPANMISKQSVEEQKNGRIKLVQETWGVFDDVFCAGNDSVFMFLEQVIDEVTALFPSKYFHIGGDECPKTHWKQCSRCQHRMQSLGLKDEHELQSWFVQRIEKYLNSKGKTLIGWDEILEGGLAPNAIVMSWRGETGGIEAAKQKHPVIMTPGKPVYFDHTQSRIEDSVTIGGYNPIEAVYAYEPIPKELNESQQKYVLGAQANVWTEYMNNSRKIEYMIFPRMAALSEVLWSPAASRQWVDFEKRLSVQLKRYERMDWNYSRAYFELGTTLQPSDNHQSIILKVRSRNPNQPVKVETYRPLEADTKIPVYDINGNLLRHDLLPKGSLQIHGSYRMEAGKDSLILTQSGVYKIMACTGTGPTNMDCRNPLSTLTQSFTFSKSTGKNIRLTHPPSTSYPGDGAFTLVNGIVNEKGMARTQEFLGFSGTDCEAVIDLGTPTLISRVQAFLLEQTSSWIWLPSRMTVAVSEDGINFKKVELTGTTIKENQALATFGQPEKARYISIQLTNKGTIEEGYPGAGRKAWLFVSELQVW